MFKISLSRRFAIVVPLMALPIMLFSVTTGQAGSYLDSAHGGGGTALGVRRLPAPYADGNCAHCHEQHASIDGNEPAPVKPGPSASLLFTELNNNTLCNYCHDSNQSNGAPNIASQIAKTNSHDPNSAIGSVLCGDCHDSHVAQPSTRRDDWPLPIGNTVSGVLLSVSGKSVASWPLPPAPGPNTESLAPASGLNDIDPATMEYQICFKCHGGQFAGLEDLTEQFNDKNYAVHPVTTTVWKNAFLWGNTGTALKAPWNGLPDTQMYCSDCHGSNIVGDPAGPHGSASPSMLTDIAAPYTNYDALCTKCHTVTSSAWVSENLVPPYAVDKDHDLAQHQLGASNPIGCLACHGGISNPTLKSSIHGANYTWPNEGINPGRPSTAFLVGGLITKNYDMGGNRYCSASCHMLDGGVGYRY